MPPSVVIAGFAERSGSRGCLAREEIADRPEETVTKSEQCMRKASAGLVSCNPPWARCITSCFDMEPCCAKIFNKLVNVISPSNAAGSACFAACTADRNRRTPLGEGSLAPSSWPLETVSDRRCNAIVDGVSHRTKSRVIGVALAPRSRIARPPSSETHLPWRSSRCGAIDGRGRGNSIVRQASSCQTSQA